MQPNNLVSFKWPVVSDYMLVLGDRVERLSCRKTSLGLAKEEAQSLCWKKKITCRWALRVAELWPWQGRAQWLHTPLEEIITLAGCLLLVSVHHSLLSLWVCMWNCVCVCVSGGPYKPLTVLLHLTQSSKYKFKKKTLNLRTCTLNS